MKGFTLIELLVVVLIIGILSAVALPQYQKAVDKAALSSVMGILKTVTEAQQVAALEQGGYPRYDQEKKYFHFSDLSVDLPSVGEDCQDSDGCSVRVAGRTFLIILRNQSTWANFYWAGPSLSRLVYNPGYSNTNTTYQLQCSSVSNSRCLALGKAMGGKNCTAWDQEGTQEYSFCFN